MRLFKLSVQVLCHAHYTPQQIAAWTAIGDNLPLWKRMLEKQYVLTAMDG